MFPDRLVAHANTLSDSARLAKLRIATAESCTGGLLGALLTSLPRSSDIFERGFVTYSNHAKSDMLGIPTDLIIHKGAVSEAVARMMAHHALERSRADISIGITGIAGPKGATRTKPVGTVHIACARKNHPTLYQHHVFHDQDREGVRLATLQIALDLLQAQIAVPC